MRKKLIYKKLIYTLIYWSGLDIIKGYLEFISVEKTPTLASGD